MSDLLADATAELYEADPDEFIALRASLVAAAREAGQADAAKGIAGLRKPTRSAWLLNTLVRSHPDVPGRLAELAAELREGGDGARIRELTVARGRLVDELTRLAFEPLDGDPPAAVREDVVATLGAAIADSAAAAELAAGTLVRAVRWAGFGEMLLSPSAASIPSEASIPSAPSPSLRDVSAGATAGIDAPPGRQPPRRALAPVRPAVTEERLAELTLAAEASAAAESDLTTTVRVLESQLEQARERLADARREAYRAEQRRKKAAEEFDRGQR